MSATEPEVIVVLSTLPADERGPALARALGDAVRAAVVELWSRDHPTR